jgi:hypothetical protein
MALRTYYSPVSGNKSSVPAADLIGAMGLSSATTVRPLAFEGDTLTGTITEAILQQDEAGGEVLHRLYKGPAIPLALFIAQLANDAVRAGAVTPLTFVAEKGMQLAFTPATQIDGHIVWNFCSDCGGSSGTSDSMESEVG